MPVPTKKLDLALNEAKIIKDALDKAIAGAPTEMEKFPYRIMAVYVARIITILEG